MLRCSTRIGLLPPTAASLAGSGCEDLTLALAACGALLEYAKKTQWQALAHVVAVRDELADLRQACRWPAAVGTVEPAPREARTSQPASHVR